MLEILSSNLLKSGIVLPSNTGPGPSTLLSYYQDPLDLSRVAGFFGEVRSGLVTPGTSIKQALGLNRGTLNSNVDTWLKFYLDGKIIFTTKRVYAYGLSWQHLNEVDAVTGNRTISFYPFSYKVRLFKGTNPDLIYNDSVGSNVPYTAKSEWNRLLFNVCSANPPSQEGDNWATYSITDLQVSGKGHLVWCQDGLPNNNNYKFLRGGMTDQDYTTNALFTSTEAMFGWRPVLELVQ